MKPLAAVWFLFLLAIPGAAVADRPNIVLVFVDDMGWRDVGYNAVDDYLETPNLDRLAREGMTFTSAYASAGNCAPSRACLISGNYSPRHGLYAVWSTERGKKARMRLQPTPNTDGLRPSFFTVAESLKAAGYATGCVGKWHLFGDSGSSPTEQGFDYDYDSFGNDQLFGRDRDRNVKGPPSDPKGVFDLTDRACEFIREHRDEPFFCYLSHHAIHGPMQARPASLAKFKEKESQGSCSAVYAANTYDLDASLGRLLDCLDELDLARNTLVVFTSDNGATPASDQEPLRGRKGSYYEGGIRVPMVARWPGVVAADSQSDVPVSNIDFYPTFAALAGASSPGPLDGADLTPLLSGAALPERSVYWFFPGYLNNPVPRGRAIDVAGGFRSRPTTVMRKGKWKLHLFEEEWVLEGGWDGLPSNGAVELYDLDADIGERHDLSASKPEIRDALLREMLDWRESVGAVAPTDPHPAYRPHPQG